MIDTLLTTTSTEGLQPLGSAPQRSFELVSNTLRTRLGTDHANLFAEPVATQHGDRIDWYAPMSGAAVPLSQLPEADQHAVRDRLGGLVADIRADADLLGNSADAQDQRLSEALLNAIEVPDEAMIYAVRGTDEALHPVLVHWAWLKDEQKSVRGILTAMVPRPGYSATAATAPAQQHWAANLPWWWLILLGWLLLAAMLAYILYLMIAPCGLNNGRLIFCPQPEAAISAIPGERQVIEDQIAALQHELALLDRSCQPTIPILPATPIPQEVPTTPETPETPETPDPVPTDPAPDNKTQLSPDEVGRKVVERGAALGALNFALSWASIDDVDLSVTCPTGQTISYKNRGDCNANYDLDANVKRDEAVTDPVENIVFDQVNPGLYKVSVHLKGSRTEGDKPVTLHVLRQDGRSQTYSGTVSDKAPEWSLNISISR